jgi:cyclophilin family peptidyl-prolyl cis-trans isomerase
MESISRQLETQIHNAKLAKEEGIALFKEKKFKEAIIKFDNGYTYIKDDIESAREAKDVAVSLLLNISNCHNNLAQFDQCKERSTEAIKLRDDNPKAYYYRGIAFAKLEHFDYAEADYKSLCDLVPTDDPGVKYLRDTIDQMKEEKSKREKAFFKSTFNKVSLYDDIDKNKKPRRDRTRTFEGDTGNNKEIEDVEIMNLPKEVNPKNPKIFMEISFGERHERKRLEFELFLDKLPKTVINFKNILLGKSKDPEQKYKGTTFHYLEKGDIMEGGDYQRRDGTGGMSVYGNLYNGEKLRYKFSQGGLLAMVNFGSNNIGSQFFITFKPISELDGKNVVFGRLVSDIDDLREIENVRCHEDGTPYDYVSIIDCGEVK